MTSDEHFHPSAQAMPSEAAQSAESLKLSPDLDTAARRTQLKIALQLLQVAGHIIIVQGEPGMGKSSFLSRLQQRLPKTHHVGLVSADQHMTLNDLFLALGATDADLQSAAIDLLHIVQQEGMWPVLMIDNAEQLNPATLDALLSLWEAAHDARIPFSLILSTALDLHSSALDAARLQERLHRINLYPLSEQQTIDYLRQQLSAALSAPAESLPLSQLRAAYQRSQGIPARIAAELDLWLSPTATTPSSSPAGRRTTVFVSVAILLLVATLVAALLIVDSQQQTTQPDPAPLALPSPALTPPPTYAEVETQTESPEVDPSQPPIIEDAPKADLFSEHMLSDLQQSVDPQAAQQPEDIDAEDQAAGTATEEPAPALQLAQPADPETSQESLPPLANEWLQSRAANAFTIQLVAAHNPAALGQFVEQHQLQKDAKLLKVQRDGRAWYVVVLGDHPSRAASHDALQRLPAAMRKDGAWVRSFGELQQMAQ